METWGQFGIFRQGEAVVYIENSLTLNHQILHEPSNRSGATITPDMTPLSPSSREVTADNDAYDGFNLESPKSLIIGTYIYTNVLNSHTGYNVTDYFRLAVIKVHKTVENVASDGFRWNIFRQV